MSGFEPFMPVNSERHFFPTVPTFDPSLIDSDYDTDSGDDNNPGDVNAEKSIADIQSKCRVAEVAVDSSKLFKIGERVEVNWNGSGNWYPAIIRCIRSDTKYDVTFDEPGGEFVRFVDPVNIRRVSLVKPAISETQSVSDDRDRLVRLSAAKLKMLKICVQWAHQSCTNGASCHFAHSSDALQFCRQSDFCEKPVNTNGTLQQPTVAPHPPVQPKHGPSPPKVTANSQAERVQLIQSNTLNPRLRAFAGLGVVANPAVSQPPVVSAHPAAPSTPSAAQDLYPNPPLAQTLGSARILGGAHPPMDSIALVTPSSSVSERGNVFGLPQVPHNFLNPPYNNLGCTLPVTFFSGDSPSASSGFPPLPPSGRGRFMQPPYPALPPGMSLISSQAQQVLPIPELPTLNKEPIVSKQFHPQYPPVSGDANRPKMVSSGPERQLFDPLYPPHPDDPPSASETVTITPEVRSSSADQLKVTTHTYGSYGSDDTLEREEHEEDYFEGGGFRESRVDMDYAENDNDEDDRDNLGTANIWRDPAVVHSRRRRRGKERPSAHVYSDVETTSSQGYTYEDIESLPSEEESVYCADTDDVINSGRKRRTKLEQKSRSGSRKRRRSSISSLSSENSIASDEPVPRRKLTRRKDRKDSKERRYSSNKGRGCMDDRDYDSDDSRHDDCSRGRRRTSADLRRRSIHSQSSKYAKNGSPRCSPPRSGRGRPERGRERGRDRSESREKHSGSRLEGRVNQQTDGSYADQSYRWHEYDDRTSFERCNITKAQSIVDVAEAKEDPEDELFMFSNENDEEIISEATATRSYHQQTSSAYSGAASVSVEDRLSAARHSPRTSIDRYRSCSSEAKADYNYSYSYSQYRDDLSRASASRSAGNRRPEDNRRRRNRVGSTRTFDDGHDPWNTPWPAAVTTTSSSSQYRGGAQAQTSSSAVTNRSSTGSTRSTRNSITREKAAELLHCFIKKKGGVLLACELSKFYSSHKHYENLRDILNVGPRKFIEKQFKHMLKFDGRDGGRIIALDYTNKAKKVGEEDEESEDSDDDDDDLLRQELMMMPSAKRGGSSVTALAGGSSGSSSGSSNGDVRGNSADRSIPLSYDALASHRAAVGSGSIFENHGSSSSWGTRNPDVAHVSPVSMQESAARIADSPVDHVSVSPCRQGDIMEPDYEAACAVLLNPENHIDAEASKDYLLDIGVLEDNNWDAEDLPAALRAGLSTHYFQEMAGLLKDEWRWKFCRSLSRSYEEARLYLNESKEP